MLEIHVGRLIAVSVNALELYVVDPAITNRSLRVNSDGRQVAVDDDLIVPDLCKRLANILFWHGVMMVQLLSRERKRSCRPLP